MLSTIACGYRIGKVKGAPQLGLTIWEVEGNSNSNQDAFAPMDKETASSHRLVFLRIGLMNCQVEGAKLCMILV